MKRRAHCLLRSTIPDLGCAVVRRGNYVLAVRTELGPVNGIAVLQGRANRLPCLGRPEARRTVFRSRDRQFAIGAELGAGDSSSVRQRRGAGQAIVVNT